MPCVHVHAMHVLLLDQKT